MSRPRVRLGIPPYLADLELWGRDTGGEWWALVVWTVQVTPPDGTTPSRPAAPRGCPDSRRSSRCSRSTTSRSRGCSYPRNRPSGPHRSTVPARTGAATTSDSSTAPSRSYPAQAGRAWGTEQGGGYG